ncbi:MAG: AmmeMemoRadiSam system radical SAM enzyme [Patescibacteria group bacterium]|jgi:pyruvate formate lyase activating enzyme
MKEALFYQKLENKQVKCELCHQFCQIAPGKRGLCGVRENQNGVLVTLVYGKVIAAHVDPIEKKPLYHFLPGTYSYSLATIGCNFRCAHCQNADISQASKEGLFFQRQEIPGEEMAPKDVIDQAKKSQCPSISYTYTEPTIFFEFAFDCMKLAQESKLKNVWVSNGYTNLPALEMAKPYLDAVNIDLKFFNDSTYKKICGARLQPVLDNLVWYKQNGVHLEVTTLIIPSLNDSDEELTGIAKFIKDKLGADTPWHVTAFWPTYKLNDLPPTSRETILQAKEIGEKAGLEHVHVGNI